MSERGRAIRPFSFVPMRFFSFALSIFVFGAAVMSGFGQQLPASAKKTTGTKKPTTRATAKTNGATATKTGTTSTKTTPGAGAKASAATSKKRTATTKRNPRPTPSVARQGAPSSDRYKEIQQALAAKGYLKSEPSGMWDADSIEAMRQFQTDRKLDPNGKLTAASLIDLGLGPKPEPTHTSPTGPGEAVPEPPKIETTPTPRP